MCVTIFTVTGSLHFGIDSNRLTSEGTSLMHFSSRSRVSNSGSSFLNFKRTDEAVLRFSLMVVEFVVELSMVLPCARCMA